MDYMIYLFQGLIVIYSITIHEFAHAWTADKLWDPTPNLQGRLTINPLAHVDPLGFILLFIVWFGRGRPVIFNPQYLQNPLRDEFWIAMAWPIANICIALVSLAIVAWIRQYAFASPATDLVGQFRNMSAIINIGMAIFNMIPLPPLDGFRIIKILTGRRYMMIEQYASYIIMWIFMLSSIPQLNIIAWFMTPAITMVYSVLSWLVSVIMVFISSLFFLIS